MIRYKKYQVTGENSPLKGLWYARPVIEETFDIEKLAKHMSNHNTPYSSGVIKGVLTDMVSCTKELILDGKNVKMDDLAIFSVGIVSKKGAQSAADFSLANNVKGLKLRARATGELSNAQINLEGQMKESSMYTVEGKPSGNKPGGSGEGNDDNGQPPKRKRCASPALCCTTQGPVCSASAQQWRPPHHSRN